MSEVQELPKGWISTTLGALGDYINGYPFNDKVWSKTGRPIIRIQNLTGTAKVTNYYDKEIDDRFIVRTGDLLVAWSATLGAFIWKGPEACLNQHIFKVIPRIDKFFHYYLIQSVLQDLYWEAHGSGMVHVTRTKFDAVEVMLPPLPEQQRIVEALEQQLSRLDAGVAVLRDVQHKLKRYRASVLKAAVEGKLTKKWRKSHPEVEPAPELLQRILRERRVKWEEEQIAKGRDPQKVKYEEPARPDVKGLPELPEGWCWATVGQITWSVKDGPHYSPKYVNNGVPFITGGNVRPSGIDFINAKQISSELHIELSKRCKPEKGDILYTKGGTTGIARVNTYDIDFNVWVHVAILKLVNSIEPLYIQHVLNSDFCYKQAQKFTHGVGNQDLGLTRMINIVLSLPPFAEQEQIVSLVEEQLSVVDTLESTIEQMLRRAARMRQSILHQAFTGQLVEQDPDDEPASVLLERIRREREEADASQKLRHLAYKGRTKSSGRRVAESTQPYLPLEAAEPEPVDPQTAQQELWDETL